MFLIREMRVLVEGILVRTLRQRRSDGSFGYLPIDLVRYRRAMRWSQSAIVACLAVLISWAQSRLLYATTEVTGAASAEVTVSTRNDDLLLTWKGDELIEVAVSKQRGLFQAPLRIKVNDRSVSLGGLYVHINELTDGFTVAKHRCGCVMGASK